MSRAERDRAIAEAFRNGARRIHLADAFGLSPRRISQIAAAHGLRRTTADQVRVGTHNRGRPRDPQLAALGNDAPFYAYLRRTMGAAYARRAMGLDKAA